MKKTGLLLFLTLFILKGFSQYKWEVELPQVVVRGVETTITLKTNNPIDETFKEVYINGKSLPVESQNEGQIKILYTLEKTNILDIKVGEDHITQKVNPIPLWTSILPPLIAIILALLLKEVISSLFIGILSGTMIMSFYTNGMSGLATGFFSTIDTYILNALNDWSHMAVIVFSMTIAGIVSIISKNGGMLGVVNRLEPYAQNPKSGQFVIWFMGVLIFFDDYANTLVVGNTMRPVADRLRISRQKLAYLVDSTAAPVAAIAFITTWIGAELGYIETGLGHLPELNESPYSVFLMSLQYAFYPIFTLAFMLMLIYKGRDFGPMLLAEKNARKGIEDRNELNEDDDEFTAKEGIRPKSFNAVIPILIVILGAIGGMYITGMNASSTADLEGLGFFRKLSVVIGNSDSFTALLWSSMAGIIAAVILTVSQKIMSLEETINSGIGGFKTMIPAMIILVLAWALAGITEDMHTAVFLQGLWSDALSPIFIPAVVFILSGMVAFSTGSSWGTMAILYPLLLPASYHVAIEAGLGHDEAMVIFYNVVSVILAGSVFGDHCSPISDTTILSSLATSCNHLEHVKTQMPYAVTVGTIAIIIGSIPAAMGVSSLITFPVGLAVLYGIVQFIGKPVE